MTENINKMMSYANIINKVIKINHTVIYFLHLGLSGLLQATSLLHLMDCYNQPVFFILGTALEVGQ